MPQIGMVNTKQLENILVTVSVFGPEPHRTKGLESHATRQAQPRETRDPWRSAARCEVRLHPGGASGRMEALLAGEKPGLDD